MVNPDEPAAHGPDDGVTATLAATIANHLVREHPPNVRPMTRDAHPKAHGCVRATFTVDPDLEPPYACGVFVPGRQYAAWIRFSNALNLRHDLVRDARGMAIKLLGVDDANLTRDCTSQDFLLVTHPAFFVANADEYVDFPSTVFRARSTAALYARVARYFFGWSPPRFRWRGAWALLRSLKWTPSPLVVGYFSQAPFQLGPGRVAKFCARPRQRASLRERLAFLVLVLAYQITSVPLVGRLFRFKRSATLLQDALWRSLGRAPASFDFCVQLGEDDPGMIEDATKRWSERRAPYRRIATIHIPREQPDRAESLALAEHLSYSPWHAVPDHRPLGSINEARRIVYERIAALRHGANGVARREPRPDETAAAYLASIAVQAPGAGSGGEPGQVYAG